TLLLTLHDGTPEAVQAALEGGSYAAQEHRSDAARWLLEKALQEPLPPEEYNRAKALLESLGAGEVRDGRSTGAQERASAEALPEEPTLVGIPLVEEKLSEVETTGAQEHRSAPPSAPAPPTRSWGQMLAGFMEERNILWGELIGGLLIV